MISHALGSRARVLVAALLAALLAVTGVVATGLPARAAAGDVSGATLDWGVKSSFRSYIVGGAQGGWTVTGVTDSVPFGWSGGTGTADAATGTVGYPGSVRFYGHETAPGSGTYALDLTLSDVRVVRVDATHANLVIDMNSGGTVTDDGIFATVDLAAATASTSGANISYSAAPATLTAVGATMMAGFYPAGTALDPVSFSWPVEQALVATTTALSVAPTASAETGTEVVLTATVTPADAGTVRFLDGATVLGEAAPVAGVATLATSALPTGSHSLTAELLPAAGHASSTSTAVSYSIVDPATSVTTTTAVSVSPAAPVAAGTNVTVTATVTAGDGSSPAGSVEFFSRPVTGAADVSLGTATVTGGVAALTTGSLPAGGQTFVAVFAPAAGFLGSQGATTANYGVVATGQPSSCTPDAGALTTSGATASWDYSDYSSDWDKTATGDITVDGETFDFANGVVTADADCAQLAFDGTLRVTAHGSYWVELEDPILTTSRTGAGTWSAVVRSYANPTAATRLALASLASVTGLPALGGSGQATATLAYAGTTARGTWSAAYSDAWSNAFTLSVPSMLRAFYYLSGTTPAQVRKPPAPITADFAWPAVTSTALTVSPAAPVTLGTSTVLQATITPSTAAGTVEFFETPAGGTERSLGSTAVLAGVAVLPVSLAAGGHTFRAAFTPSGSFSASGATVTTNYGVVDTGVPAICSPGTGASTVTNVTAAWAYSAYSAEWTKTASGDVSVSGQDFVLTDGVATVGEDCTRVTFDGSLRVTAYPTLGGFWIELVDPVLTIGADGTGSWAAHVSSGTGVADGPAASGPFLTVATLTGETAPDLTGAGTSALALDFAGTTAQGTWNAAYSDAWSNGYVLAAPSALRAFYYKSGTSPANGNKPPAPIRIGRADAIATTTGLTASASSVTSGAPLTLTATVAPTDAAGVVEFRDGSDVVGSAPVSAGVATLSVSTLGLGAHTLTARFAPADPLLYLASTSTGVAVSVESPSTPPLTAGSLSWGVKQSFRAYVVGPTSQGSIQVTAGAGSNGGTFWFPQANSSVGAGGLGSVDYRGTVRFSGHGGALSLTVADPVVRITGATTAVLSVITTSGRVDFATLDLGAASRSTDASGAVSYSGVPATLTAAGAADFAGFYSTGTALDPVSFTIGATNTASGRGTTVAAASAEEPRVPAAAPPATEGITVEGELSEGGEFTASASGFQPNESGILVVIYSEPTLLDDDATADADGVVTWSGRLPAGLTGTHTLTFQGSVDRGIVLDIPAAEQVGCPVQSATLAWGFKESFRSYITGLAAGDWQTADGASYATPEFRWSESDGAWDGESSSGLAFAGSVRFTGHDGALDTTIANPRLVIDGDAGALFLDVSGTTQGGTPVTAAGIEFASLDLGAAEHSDADGVVTIAGIPATLTEAGAAAFGTYEAGEALDPVTVTIVAGEACVQPVAATVDPPAPVAASEASPFPWWWLLAGAVLLALLIVGLVVILRRRAAA